VVGLVLMIYLTEQLEDSVPGIILFVWLFLCGGSVVLKWYLYRQGFVTLGSTLNPLSVDGDDGGDGGGCSAGICICCTWCCYISAWCCCCLCMLVVQPCIIWCQNSSEQSLSEIVDMFGAKARMHDVRFYTVVSSPPEDIVAAIQKQMRVAR